MKVGLLTSSRADFGIQVPLLRALDGDPYFSPELIVFGSHLDDRFGRTLDEIHRAGFTPTVELPPVMVSDQPAGIAQAMSATMNQFSGVWSEHEFDLVVALGDRYEMFAAVSAALPFGVRVAHLHGGETTVGAIDNAMRHAITHMSTIHFVSAEPYRLRVVELVDDASNVHNVGALSVDNLAALEHLGVEEIKARTGVDMAVPTVLVTFHPETAGTGSIDEQMQEFTAALGSLEESFQILITMPNADTHNQQVRELMKQFVVSADNAVAVESLGSLLYLSCMQHCSFVLGNSSSGYVEAAFFPKPVIDVGERQTGRIVTPNITRCPIEAEAILIAASDLDGRSYPSVGMYGDGTAAQQIIAVLKGLE